jgi:hypothetical protein
MIAVEGEGTIAVESERRSQTGRVERFPKPSKLHLMNSNELRSSDLSCVKRLLKLLQKLIKRLPVILCHDGFPNRFNFGAQQHRLRIGLT